MVSRPATNRQNLDLQNAESSTAWIMSFVAKCRAEKEEDKVNNDGTLQGLQVINLFLSMCGQDAIIKLRSLMSRRNLIDTPYKDMKMCRSKPQPNSGKYNKQNNFCEEENVSSKEASPASEMGMFYTKEQILSISVTWEYISINNCKVKMQVDTGADSTVISSKI